MQEAKLSKPGPRKERSIQFPREDGSTMATKKGGKKKGPHGAGGPPGAKKGGAKKASKKR